MNGEQSPLTEERKENTREKLQTIAKFTLRTYSFYSVKKKKKKTRLLSIKNNTHLNVNKDERKKLQKILQTSYDLIVFICGIFIISRIICC